MSNRWDCKAHLFQATACTKSELLMLPVLQKGRAELLNAQARRPRAEDAAMERIHARCALRRTISPVAAAV